MENSLELLIEHTDSDDVSKVVNLACELLAVMLVRKIMDEVVRYYESLEEDNNGNLEGN